jgi:hypothetical protein
VSYPAKATVSIIVGVAAAIAIAALATTVADVIGGAILAASLVVLMRALLSMAGDSSG